MTSAQQCSINTGILLSNSFYWFLKVLLEYSVTHGNLFFTWNIFRRRQLENVMKMLLTTFALLLI